jgi:hypothetical protein
MDRKTIYREIYQQYLDEGYTAKEAKKLASEETSDMLDMSNEFVKDILDSSQEEE